MGMIVSVGVYTQWVSVITHHSSRGKGRHGDDGLYRDVFTMVSVISSGGGRG